MVRRPGCGPTRPDVKSLALILNPLNLLLKRQDRMDLLGLVMLSTLAILVGTAWWDVERPETVKK